MDKKKLKTFKQYFTEETYKPVDNWDELLHNNEMLRIGVDLMKKIEHLQPNGEILMVGGVVRDLLLNKPIKDIDFATNISLSFIEQHFSTHNIGNSKEFGIIVINYKGVNFEIASYREDIY